MHGGPTRTPLSPAVLFTGLPAAGKTSLACACRRLLADAGVSAELVDGDELRARLPPALTHSRADRLHQFARAVFVSELLAAHRVIPLIALVAPFAASREQLRAVFAPAGCIEVHVCTPLAVCRARDQKNLYARLGDSVAREIVAPFEVPENPDYRIDTSDQAADEAAAAVVARLIEMTG
jgi:adenylylsulfate kinase-like enzyme